MSSSLITPCYAKPSARPLFLVTVRHYSCLSPAFHIRAGDGAAFWACRLKSGATVLTLISKLI
jgi:hypothetical protein